MTEYPLQGMSNSLGIIVSDTIVSTVEVEVAVYNEILGDPANDPEIVANSRRDTKRTRRRIPQSLVRRVAQTLPLKPEPRLKIPVSLCTVYYSSTISIYLLCIVGRREIPLLV